MIVQKIINVSTLAGNLQVKNREEWRTNLTNKNYSELDSTIVKRDRTNKKLQKIKKASEKDRHSRSNTPEIEPKEYQDPGRFLGAIGEEEHRLIETDKLKNSIKGLALALAQVAQAVDPKYLKKPLGKSCLYIY